MQDTDPLATCGHDIRIRGLADSTDCRESTCSQGVVSPCQSMATDSERTQMSKFGRNAVLITALLCGFGTVGTAWSKGPSRFDNTSPGGTGISLSGNFRGSGFSTLPPVFFVSLGGYSQSTGAGNLADVAAGLTAEDPVVLLLIGVGLAALGAIGLRRLAKSPSGITAGRKGRPDGRPDQRPDSD